MNKHIISAIAAALPLLASAQTATEAYQLSRYDLRGTARFMSMGGAFGALGGDLSTLNQNPGGIGVYRKSDIGLTLDINMQSAKTVSSIETYKDNQTKVSVPNFGYVGSAYTGSELMPIFNWGFSYGRVASFNRRYQGSLDMNGSLSNYIAGYTSGNYQPGELTSSEENYWDQYHAPWMSILAYNAFMINPVGNTTQYNGLWNDNAAAGKLTRGVADYAVEEAGYVDEYEINLGGNFSDIVYWGIGIGITDIDYRKSTFYAENLDWATLPVISADRNNVTAGPPAQTGNGDSGFDLNSYTHVSGTGFNFKAGVIFKPINELRFGLAVHTPTYYNLSQSSYADARTYYGFAYNDKTGLYDSDPSILDTGTPIDAFNWKLRTPWRLIASAATVLGSSAIISVDYEYRPYQSMSAKFDNGDECKDVNGDIRNYYKAANILRIGAEYRLTSNLSLRAGYAYESTPTGADVRNDRLMVYTSNPFDSGVTPSYTLDNSTQYITCGLGYRYKGFYADAAYVHKARKSEFHPYTGNNGYTADPFTSEIKQNDNSLVFSIGYRF